MADISKIEALDGVTYDLKDAKARESLILYGTCDTEADVANKVATLQNVSSFSLKVGITVNIKFTNSNTIKNSKLNVNNTGALYIMRYGTTKASTSASSSWNAGAVVPLTYDGTYWVINSGWDNDSTYSNMSQAEASTGTATKARSISAKVLNDTIAEKAAKVVELTQAEYDALEDPDPSTVYLITDSNDYNADKMDVTLYAANWSDAVYTITDEHIGTDTVQLIIPKEGITDTQLEALQGANIQAYGQTAGELYLKAYGDVPSIDIPVSVIFHPGVQVREVEQQKQEIYSETETVIGTWIDGKPIYRKVILVTNWTPDSTIDSRLGSSIDTLISLCGSASDTTNRFSFPYVDNTYYITCYINRSSGIITKRGATNAVNEGYILLEYTKTTD